MAQFALTKAFSYAPAGQIGFYTYNSVAFAALFGWLILNEVISWQIILEILVIWVIEVTTPAIFS